jgi:hypothetical protein
MDLSQKAIERASEVFLRARLRDVRLERRAVALAQALAENPKLSLPQAWSTSGTLQAGYDFLRNPKCEFAALMAPIQEATYERALNEACVLVLHDTTDVVCPAADAEEVGYLPTGKAGFFVHHALCIKPDRTPLGILWSDVWARPQRTTGRARNASGSELAKLEERESDRWLEAITEAHLWSEGCKQVVHVLDSEGDSFRIFEHAQALNADFVIRLSHNRRTDDGLISDELAHAPVKLRRTVSVNARQRKSAPRSSHGERTARDAVLSVRCARVTIQPPRHSPEKTEVELNVLQILEENPEKGCEPIVWMLATSLPIDKPSEIERIIDIYRARWVVEEFHKALKTGCMFEKRQLESFEALTTLLALSYPIACELLRVRSRARQPGLAASDVLRQSMLDCLRAHPRTRPLSANPTAEEALGVIAALGGHIKWNGPPGWQSLAVGYMQLLAFEQGWLAALSQRQN